MMGAEQSSGIWGKRDDQYTQQEREEWIDRMAAPATLQGKYEIMR